MSTANKLAAAVRTGKGKGDSRRARAAGNVPAVLYGHDTDPQHLLLPARDFAAILRNNGTNAIVELDIEGNSQLALTKQVDVHPIRNYIEHADLLIVRRGEKVIVEVPVIIEGEAGPNTLIVQDSSYIEIEADALSIPENIVVSVEGLPAVTNIYGADVSLPEGVSLISDPELLVVSVNAAPTAADLDTPAPGDDEDADAAEAAE